MPTLLNGGMFLALIPLAVLFLLAVASVTRYRCPLVDRQGFPCVHRFTLRTDLEKHLEHGHGMAHDDARRCLVCKHLFRPIKEADELKAAEEIATDAAEDGPEALVCTTCGHPFHGLKTCDDCGCLFWGVS